MAKWAKKRFCAEILLKTGWNLSEAEVEYVPDGRVNKILTSTTRINKGQKSLRD